MNRCLALFLALILATITVSSACVAAPSDWVHFTFDAGRGGDGRIHASFRDRDGSNSWSGSFQPAELAGLDVGGLRSPGVRPLRFALVREAGRLDCAGNGGNNTAEGNC